MDMISVVKGLMISPRLVITFASSSMSRHGPFGVRLRSASFTTALPRLSLLRVYPRKLGAGAGEAVLAHTSG